MIRATILLCFLAICALSAPVPNEETLKLQKLVSSCEQLTREEKDLLMEMAKDHKDGQTPEDFMLTIKTKSPSIYKKITNIRNVLKERYNLLNEEAQGFVKNIIAKTIAYLKARSNRDDSTMFKIAKTIGSEYENMSEEAKASLGEHLPIVNPAAASLIHKTNE